MQSPNSYNQILGLNRRNQEYVRPYNSPAAKRIADNKVKTKRILAKYGVKTPEVYKLIRGKKQLEFLDWDSLPKSFVIKPNQGTGGNGIIVFYGKKKGETAWIRPSGEIMTKRDIILHIENILEGRYSMGNRSDIAIIEERVNNHPFLKQFSYKGVPDIRVICFNNVPIMAMTRLPTKRSNGTANLHSGAICTGIDIATGITTYSMHNIDNKTLMSDTYEMIDSTLDLQENKTLSGIQIPFWEEILEIALKCQKASGLGYIGVDIALDRDKGPVVFELNARPGLGIQVANQAGLRWRLEKVKGLDIKSIKHGIRVAKNIFGGEIEESIEAISGRKVINIKEKILAYYKDTDFSKKNIKKEAVTSFADTGVLTSRINYSLASRLGYLQAIKFFNGLEIPKNLNSFTEAEELIDKYSEKITNHPDIKRMAIVTEDDNINVRPVITVTVKISGQQRELDMIITKNTITPVILGSKDLKGYLIDTSKTFK
jgi:alpha-L-glutamate ligase-like protein